MRKVSATQVCKQRMGRAKTRLHEASIGQLAVIQHVVQVKPELDKLTNIIRWKNAYSLHVADPELTELVEAAAAALIKE